MTLYLPKRDQHPHRRGYGALRVAAQYCGFSDAPHAIPGQWQPGWHCPEHNVHPELVIGSTGRSRDRKETGTFFVARDDQVRYLRAQGYQKVFAIGAPIIYASQPSVQRIPRSLLVMPQHTLSDSHESGGWDIGPYAAYIRSIAHQFDKVYLCLHSSCFSKGFWSKAIDGNWCEVIEGANIHDQNSLQRMTQLFGQVEFVTSHVFGSHIAYASHLGCKVSICGPRPEFRKSDYERVLFYRNVPEILDQLAAWDREKFLEKKYPQFLCDPWEAKCHVQWGAWQLGEQHKRTPRELARLFGWDPMGRVNHQFRRIERGVRTRLGMRTH